jgi:cellulose synthase/poly-beta-1,6-N-acetylglucosamine synthase-like glycosyltransferase
MVVFVLRVIFLIFFVFIGLSVLYLFISSFWGRFFFRKKFILPSSSGPVKKIAILVPAYKEDGIILSTAEGLLTLDYPRELYDVYIIADSFQPETVQQLKQLPIQVVEVSFVKSTKAKSLNETFSRITKSYDIALICDADNIFSRDFLRWLDYAFQQGARAVQGRRIAKNLDSPFAILDACSEAINNHLFRKGSNALGLSSAVIGSGMAFEYDVIREVLLQVDSVVEDKELALGIAEKGLFIHYLEDAVIYDEKVGSAKAFGNQRKRWVSGQHAFLQKLFLPSF